MRSFICVLSFALVSILLCCSANKGMKFSYERDFIYGEGTQEAADMLLAGQIAGDHADKSVAVQTRERYSNYFNRFIKETGLPEDSDTVGKFDDIIKRLLSPIGDSRMQLRGIETVGEVYAESKGKIKADIVKRIHAGASDRIIVEAIKKHKDVMEKFKQTALYDEMQARIADYKEYITHPVENDFFIYSEGFSAGRSRMKVMVAGKAKNSARIFILEKIIDRYFRYLEMFVVETGLPEDSDLVGRFKTIISEFSPKPGTIEMKYTEFEIVEENIEENDGIVRAKFIARTHIGYSDTLIMEKIKLDEDLYGTLKKTRLYKIIQKHIDDMKKYSAK